MSALPKTFDPAEIEARWYAHWEANGLFRPARPEAEPWTIVNPPPNVTGSLHIGHALDNTLQDILVRHARLQGKDALWVVGTDHAGIATQMVVERRLAEQGAKRADFTREEFVAKVWEWKAQSGGEITRQLRRLGASMDWRREQFTMDPHFVRAVNKVFVQLYNEGLLYRDKRLVNWDPGLKTAISDLEVETRDVQGKFWHFRYPLEEGFLTRDGKNHIVVATTRPETMLADMAVAVHPDDQRYAELVGRKVHVVLPITGRRVPIIADEHADPTLGSGAVKITPGHDFNDFEVGKRAGIKPAEMLNMFDAEARVVEMGIHRLERFSKAHGRDVERSSGAIPNELIGLDRFEARERVVALLKVKGALEKVEDRVVPTPFGDRSGVVIEPWLTDQWYVDAETLAKPAIEAVRSGAIRIVPKSWEKTWFNWMENIQPWCVSRQLLWGHQLPAWYAPTKEGNKITHSFGKDVKREVFVAENFDVARRQMSEFYDIPEDQIVEVEPDFNLIATELSNERTGNPLKLYVWRDLDVLDTWFSSALWPFATLEWPDDSELLARHYPNSVLISGFDILFFWDARMIMQGLHFMGEPPFKTLYLHGLVRAKDGSKMSKSKGNTVDPLGLIDRYGADALRFFLASVESQGRDIKMDEKRVEGYRNFATKLWNAARFCQANGVGASASLEPPAAELAVNRWIIAETVKTIQQLDLAFADLRFDAAAGAIYHFVWDRFCDWYLELIKGEMADETRAVTGWVLDQILVMLHPFMPFITEELWNAMGERPYELIVAKWPIADARALDPEAEREVDWLIGIITEIRSTRNALEIPYSTVLFLQFGGGVPPEMVQRTARHASIFERLSTVRYSPELVGEAEAGEFLPIILDGIEYSLHLPQAVDIGAIRLRAIAKTTALERQRDSVLRRLENSSFRDNAKPEAVEKAKDDYNRLQSDTFWWRKILEKLGDQ